MLLLGGQPHTPNAVLQISLVWVVELTAPVGTGHSQYFVAVFQVVPQTIAGDVDPAKHEHVVPVLVGAV